MTETERMELGARIQREAQLREEATLLFNTGSFERSQLLWEEANTHLRRINELRLYEATY